LARGPAERAVSLGADGALLSVAAVTILVLLALHLLWRAANGAIALIGAGRLPRLAGRERQRSRLAVARFAAVLEFTARGWWR
jgi:hypothetical protein